MVPHFTGRQQECDDILRVLTSTSARLVSVSGPPGFGKTSLAIAVGHQLRQLGQPVYFLSLRSVKTAEELISDLLNTFAHASDVTGRERSKLCGLLSAIPSNICIILDNADDLFESSGETSQNVLDLLEKIFSHCKNVSFLLTTTTSLKSVLGRKFGDHMSVGVASLDRKSAQMLVQEIVPPADENECCRVAEVCGDVPLAIKLLCGQIVDEKKSISQFLDHFSRSSKPVVKLLDDPDAPNDQRLNVLFESYFKRLSREEQEAFVCLSVFVSEVFDEQAAVNVIGGDEDTSKKTLLRLKRKYLVEGNFSEPVLFCFHPLIKSFSSEKAAGMKEIACEAERRFLRYYVQLFEDLNSQFLAGNSLLAFHDFEFSKENMVHSLSEGLQNEAFFDALFDVLSDADLFLDTICYFERGWMFDNIYNIAIATAKEQRKFKAVHQLLIAKAVAEITWYDGATLALLKEAEEIEKQNPLLISEVVMGKRMCYLGIHQLICKAEANGGEILETGISLLSSENTVLKVLCSQILALITLHEEKSSYYWHIVLTECANKPSLYAFFKAIQEDYCADENEDENPKAISQPLILALALFIYHIAYKNDMKEVIYKLGLPISQLKKKIEVEAHNDRLYLPLLFIVENTLAKVKMEQESPTAMKLALDDFIGEYGRLNPDTAARYYNIGNILLSQKDYDAALTCHYQALDIRLKLYGHNHADTANSYYQIGRAQLEKKDYKSALHWHQQALDVTVALYGKEHASSARSYYCVAECQCEMQDYDSALESHQQALDIRLKLYGHNHADTANSYYQIATAQLEKKDYKPALQSFEQALDISQNLHGKIHSDVSLACHQIGVTKYRLKEYDSALHWHQQALDVTVELYGKEHASSANGYSWIGDCQCEMQDYDSALESYQQALDVRLKLYGHNHADTADSYYEIGRAQLEKKDYKSALQSFEQALDIRQNLHGKIHPDVSFTCSQIGATKYYLKEYDSALDWHQQALDIRVALYGKEHASSANSYSWIANCQCEMQDYDSALESYQQALDIRLKLYGHNHADTANNYCQIGRAQLEKKDYNSALQSFEQALDIKQNLHGKVHPDVSSTCNQIGGTKYRLKEYDSALHWHQESLDIRVAFYGKEHPAAADSYFNIAECQCEMQDYDSALESCQQALDIRLKLFGQKSGATSDSYDQLEFIRSLKKVCQSSLELQSKNY
jgi:tetratricopeptide (TPR) repeat protein